MRSQPFCARCRWSSRLSQRSQSVRVGVARHRRDAARLTSAGRRRDMPLPIRQPYPHSDQRPAWHENSGLDGWRRSRQHARSGDVRADGAARRARAGLGRSIDRRERPAHLEGDAIRPRDDRNRSTPSHELGEPPIQGDRTGGLPLQVAPHRLAPTRVRLVELRERSPEILTDPHRLHRSDARRSMRR